MARTYGAHEVRVTHGRLLIPPTPKVVEPSRFSASWSSTLHLLCREAGMLGAREVVLCVDVDESALRLDGGIRANARPRSPGVEVYLPSTERGPVRFSCGRYEGGGSWGYLPGWQANVRAVALGMEALRKVERYGIAEDGEQYRGWQALPAGEPGAPSTVEAAARFVAEHAGILADGLLDPGPAGDAARAGAFRKAAARLHPDAGGDAESFRHLTAARALLDSI